MQQLMAIRSAALTIALILGSAVGASAQVAAPPAAQTLRGPDGGRGAGPAQLPSFELSAEQKTKLEVITAKYAGENKAAQELMATDFAAGLKKLMTLRDKVTPEIRAILTADQQAIFDRNVAEMKVRMGTMGKPPAP